MGFAFSCVLLSPGSPITATLRYLPGKIFIHDLSDILPREAKLVTTDPIGRDDAIGSLGIEPVLSAVVFQTPIRTVSTVVPIDEGAAVIIPEARIPPDEALFSEQEAALQAQLQQERVQQHLTQWFAALRQSAALTSYVEEPQ